MATNHQNWYHENAHRLTCGGLWLRGGELNTLPLDEFDRRLLRVLFTRASTYFDTGYSFTHQLLYQLAANTTDVFPDLAYLPPASDASVFDEAAIPWWIGTQTKKNPLDFDLIGISNSIVQELVNLPILFEKSGIPTKKSVRLGRNDVPLVILGGANALYTSCLWNQDPIIDGIFVGESDAAIRRILEVVRDGKQNEKDKRAILADLETIPGFFQPENPRSTRKSFIWSLNKSEALEKAPIYFVEDQVGRSHLQISEGCPCFCSFCAESWDRKPYRERKADVLRDVALKMKTQMGLEAIDLYSFNFNMHSDFYQVLWDLVPLFRSIGLKSQRFDLLAHDPQMIEFQHAIEKASITCGLEGISPRLRAYLHKNLENEQLHQSLQAIFRSKARELKVFLIATGLETHEDFEALSDLLLHMEKIRRNAQAGTRIVFSMTPLVRFPWTPLEYENGYSISHYDSIIRKAAHVVRTHGYEFRESAELSEYWVSQILIRADDPKIFDALAQASRDTQFVYYRTVTDAFQKSFELQLKRSGLEPAKLLSGHNFDEGQKKPWAVIDTGVKRDFLWSEVLRARTFIEIDYCLGRSWTEAKCFLCGGCPSKEHILDIVKSSQKRTFNLESFKARIANARSQEVPFILHIHADLKARGLSRSHLAVAVARALMISIPRFNEFYRGFERALWSKLGATSWVDGDDFLTFSTLQGGLALLHKSLRNADTLRNINLLLDGWGKVIGLVEKIPQLPSLRFEGISSFGPSKYLSSRGLKYMLKKHAGVSKYELTPPSLKKGVLQRLEHDEQKRIISVEPGRKFELGEFLKETLAHPPADFAIFSHFHSNTH